MPTEPEGSVSACDSGESKDKKVCTSQESQESQESHCLSQRRLRVRLNTSLHSPTRAIPGCLDGDVNIVDGEEPPGPAAENTRSPSRNIDGDNSRARSDRSNMRFEADRVRESIRREYNRELGKIGPWL